MATFLILTLLSIATGVVSRCVLDDLLDVIFVVDSSGSVYDDQYFNWETELAVASNLVGDALPLNTRVALINFSGCSQTLTVEQCKEQGRLKKMITLNDYGTPNDLQALYDRIDAMGPADFNGGYTWTREALDITVSEFEANSTNTTNKAIVLITDGEPYPYNQGHEPCKTSTNYISDTLQAVRDLDVFLIAVGIQVLPSTIDDFFTCLVQNFSTDFFYCSNFNATRAVTPLIADLICSHFPSTPLTATPSTHPSSATQNPSTTPTAVPSGSPTQAPSSFAITPTAVPTRSASGTPTGLPSNNPSVFPTIGPSRNPTQSPIVPGIETNVPSASPIPSPSSSPTELPSSSPIETATATPSASPSEAPSQSLNATPTAFPSASPTASEWEPCIEEFVLSTEGDANDGGDQGVVSIDIDSTLRKLRIRLIGPSAKWFGIGFGSHVMSNTFAITVSGQSSADIVQRVLENHKSGSPLGAIADATATDDGSNVNVTVVLDWNDVFDFTEFLLCNNLESLPIIWARGMDANFGYHGSQNTNNALELVSCACDDIDVTTTTATLPSPTAAPTEDIFGDTATRLQLSWTVIMAFGFKFIYFAI